MNADPYKLVAVGGGSGTATILQGLREAVDMAAEQGDERAVEAEIVGLVTGVDDGGSAGRLAAAENTLPVGDLRRGLSALTPDARVARRLEHRFGPEDDEKVIRAVGRGLLNLLRKNGQLHDEPGASAMVQDAVGLGLRQDTLKGHSFGNLLLTSETKRRGDLAQASDAVGELVGARGRVLPVSGVRHRLVVVDGERTYIGEHVVDDLGENDFVSPRDITVGLTTDMEAEPDNYSVGEIPLHPEAERIVQEADVVVTGLGSRLTSVLPGLEALKPAFKEADARVVVATNLVEQPESAGMPAEERVEEVRAATGRVDAVVVNKDIQPLAKLGLKPVDYDRDVLSLMTREHDVDPLEARHFIRVHERDLVMDGLRKAARNDQLAAGRSRVVTRGVEVGEVAIDVVRSHDFEQSTL